jgi:MFS family permease
MNVLWTVSPVLLLIAGFIICFFGYRLLRLTLGLAGFGVGLALGLLIAGLIAGVSQVLTIVLAIVFGILGAILAAALYKFGVFLLGAGTGALIAGVVVAATGWHYPMIARVLAAIAGGILTLFLERPLISILSALAGAWGIVLGAFRLFGWHHISAHPQEAPANYGVMIALWLGLGLTGVMVQLRSRHRHKRERTSPRPGSSSRRKDDAV